MRRRTVFAICVVLLVASGALLASAAKEGKKDAAAKGKKKAPVTFLHDNQTWTVHQNKEGRAFFYNMATGSTQWTDPRATPLSANQRTLVLALFVAPLVLMVAGAAGYLYWVRSTHPKLFNGPKKVKGLKNWERALIPPKINKPKDLARTASPTPPAEDVKKAQ